jgi:protein disulfide-isomerase A6
MVVFAKGAKEPVDYQGARSEVDFVRYLNEHAGTHRLVGGALDDMAGRITDMDELAKKLAAATNDAEIGYVYEEIPDVLSRHDTAYFRVCGVLMIGMQSIMPRFLRRLRRIRNIL